MEYGGHSEVGSIDTLLLKPVASACISQPHIDQQWRALNYRTAPDFAQAQQEYDDFEALLKRFVPSVLHLPESKQTGIDSLYVRDCVVMTDGGAILCNMGKEARRGEPQAAGSFLSAQGIPIKGAIEGGGRLEGGDVVWLDRSTLVVGSGYRTNEEGIRQLGILTREWTEQIVVVPLPHWQGPADVLHLMSLISPIDTDLAAVYSPLLPVPFRQWLVRRGLRLIEVPEAEFDSMGCNILAVAPRVCVVLSGNPRTRQLLEAEGVTVVEYSGEEISRKGDGGPTCLTRPLRRLP